MNVIALLCETAARASEDTSPGILTPVAGVLLIVGGLLATWLGRRG